MEHIGTLGGIAALALALAALAWALSLRSRLARLNPHARLLGRVVEARVYEAGGWERCVVVAVSWEGAVCVRREDYPQATGKWIGKRAAPARVREVGR